MKNKSFYLDLISTILSEETKDVWINPSSSFQADNLSFSANNDISNSVEKSKSEYHYSSNEKANYSFSDVERLVNKRNMEIEEAQKDILVAHLVKEIEKALDLYGTEGDGLSSAENKIIEIEKKYNMRILGEVIQAVYIKNFNKSSYLVGICSSLLRYDLCEVQPWGAAMLAGFLNHPDEKVKEATVQLIDNWADIALLPILKTLQIASKWMQNYVNDVIESLERENVLYQKAI